jgi:hypothetical protein
MTAANLQAGTTIMAGVIADRIQQAITATLLTIYPDDPEAAEAAVIAEGALIRRGADHIAARVARAVVDSGRAPGLPVQMKRGGGYLLTRVGL